MERDYFKDKFENCRQEIVNFCFKNYLQDIPSDYSNRYDFDIRQLREDFDLWANIERYPLSVAQEKELNNRVVRYLYNVLYKEYLKLQNSDDYGIPVTLTVIADILINIAINTKIEISLNNKFNQKEERYKIDSCDYVSDFIANENYSDKRKKTELSIILSKIFDSYQGFTNFTILLEIIFAKVNIPFSNQGLKGKLSEMTKFRKLPFSQNAQNDTILYEVQEKELEQYDFDDRGFWEQERKNIAEKYHTKALESIAAKDINELENILAETELQRLDLQVQLSELEKRFLHTQNLLSTKQNNIQDLAEQIDTIRHNYELQKAKYKMEKGNSKHYIELNDKFQKEYNILHQDILTLHKDKKILSEQIDSLNSDKKAIIEQVDCLILQNKEQKNQIDDLIINIARVKDDNLALSLQLQDNKFSKLKVAAQAEEDIKIRNTLEEEISILQDKLMETSSVKEKYFALLDQHSQCQSGKNAIDIERIIKSASEDILKIQNLLLQKEEELGFCKKELEEVLSQQSGSRELIEEYKKKLQALSLQNGKQINALYESKKNFDNQVKDFQELIKEKDRQFGLQLTLVRNDCERELLQAKYNLIEMERSQQEKQEQIDQMGELLAMQTEDMYGQQIRFQEDDLRKREFSGLEVERYRAVISDLEQQLHVSLQNYIKMQKGITELEIQKKDLFIKIENLSNRNRQQEEYCTEEAKHFSELQKAYDIALEQLNKLNKEKKSQQYKLSKIAEQIKMQQEDFYIQKNKLQSEFISEQLNLKTEYNQQIKQQEQQSKTELQNKQEEISNLESQLKQLNTEKTNLTINLNSELNKLTQYINNLELDIKNLNEQKEEVLKKLNNLKKENSLLINNKEELEKLHQNLNLQIEQIDKDRISKEQEIKNLKQNIINLHEDILNQRLTEKQFLLSLSKNNIKSSIKPNVALNNAVQSQEQINVIPVFDNAISPSNCLSSLDSRMINQFDSKINFLQKLSQASNHWEDCHKDISVLFTELQSISEDSLSEICEIILEMQSNFNDIILSSRKLSDILNGDQVKNQHNSAKISNSLFDDFSDKNYSIYSENINESNTKDIGSQQFLEEFLLILKMSQLKIAVLLLRLKVLKTNQEVSFLNKDLDLASSDIYACDKLINYTSPRLLLEKIIATADKGLEVQATDLFSSHFGEDLKTEDSLQDQSIMDLMPEEKINKECVVSQIQAIDQALDRDVNKIKYSFTTPLGSKITAKQACDEVLKREDNLFIPQESVNNQRQFLNKSLKNLPIHPQKDNYSNKFFDLKKDLQFERQKNSILQNSLDLERKKNKKSEKDLDQSESFDKLYDLSDKMTDLQKCVAKINRHTAKPTQIFKEINLVDTLPTKHVIDFDISKPALSNVAKYNPFINSNFSKDPFIDNVDSKEGNPIVFTIPVVSLILSVPLFFLISPLIAGIASSAIFACSTIFSGFAYEKKASSQVIESNIGHEGSRCKVKKRLRSLHDRGNIYRKFRD
jgi:hypothetical protein